MTKSIAVHPLVVLSIQDHYKRTSPATRVVGALLGTHTAATTRITNSFAVPFAEDPTDPLVWFLDHDYMQNMRELFKKVAAREQLVGWYHSGPAIQGSDMVIHRIFQEHLFDGAGGGARPVMVVFEPGTGAFEGYYVEGGEEKEQFVHVPGRVEAEEAEAVGVEHLLRDVSDCAVGSLSAGLSGRIHELRGTEAGLREIVAYLDAVLAGRIPANQDILASLQRSFITGHSTLHSDQMVDNQVLIYVGHLARSILSLHDLVENKELVQ